jgi:hypothetical protein
VGSHHLAQPRGLERLGDDIAEPDRRDAGLLTLGEQPRQRQDRHVGSARQATQAGHEVEPIDIWQAGILKHEVTGGQRPQPERLCAAVRLGDAHVVGVQCRADESAHDGVIFDQ